MALTATQEQLGMMFLYSNVHVYIWHIISNSTNKGEGRCKTIPATMAQTQ